MCATVIILHRASLWFQFQAKLLLDGAEDRWRRAILVFCAVRRLTLVFWLPVQCQIILTFESGLIQYDAAKLPRQFVRKFANALSKFEILNAGLERPTR